LSFVLLPLAYPRHSVTPKVFVFVECGIGAVQVQVSRLAKAVTLFGAPLGAVLAGTLSRRPVKGVARLQAYADLSKAIRSALRTALHHRSPGRRLLCGVCRAAFPRTTATRTRNRPCTNCLAPR